MTRDDALSQLTTRDTPGDVRADPRQLRNNEGGFSFAVTPWQRLDRFLVLGVDGGTFYVKPRPLALDNLANFRDLIALDGLEVVRRIVDVSRSGRAPRQQPGLFALAACLAFGDLDTRRAAAQVLPDVARTGSTLKTFVAYQEQLRGWGTVAKRATADWFLNQDVDKLAYQSVKYRQRDGWTDRDLLRLAHPEAAKDDLSRRALFDWMCRGDAAFASADMPDVLLPADDPLRIVEGFERVRRATFANEVATLVGEYRLPWEAVPDEWLNDADVLTALVDAGMPQTALIRQLPRLTRAGLLPARGGRTNEVTHQLTNVERLKAARVHPLNLLVALRTYASGRSDRGKATWHPTQRVVDALDTAFYAAFDAVEPTGQRFMLSLDVSASMTWTNCVGAPITPREASTALALVTANVESDYVINAFSSIMIDAPISPRQRLDDAVRRVGQLPAGGTDCSRPMRQALDENVPVDVFVIFTDSETGSYGGHPFQALRRYRERTGIAAKLVVVGMTSTGFTIADPSDAGSLDVVGFDTAVPGLINDFARGGV